MSDEDKKLKNESQETEKSVSEDKVFTELEEIKSKYLRALADYQNLDKQTQNWKEEFVQFANSGLIRRLLEVLDNLEKAQEHLKDEGLLLVVSQFKNVLQSEGLTELEVAGKKYDPNTAEVVSTLPGQEENIVETVVQKGYKLKDKIIKPAKVIVSVKAN